MAKKREKRKNKNKKDKNFIVHIILDFYEERKEKKTLN